MVAIRVNAKEVRNGNMSFIAFSARIGDKWYKIKFNKDCNDVPRTRGVYEIKVDEGNTSLERGKPYINKDGEERQGNDIIWIRRIDAIRQYTEEELRGINSHIMTAFFNGK